jgi:hypothetical protein
MIIAYFANISWRRHREAEKIVHKERIKAEKQEEIKGQELKEENCRLQTSFFDKI